MKVNGVQNNTWIPLTFIVCPLLFLLFCFLNVNLSAVNMSECERMGMKNILMVFLPPKKLFIHGPGIIQPLTVKQVSLFAFCSSPLGVDALREKELASGLSGLECVEFILDELILTPSSLKSVRESDKATNTAGRFLSQRGLEKVRPYREIRVTRGRLTVSLWKNVCWCFA